MKMVSVIRDNYSIKMAILGYVITVHLILLTVLNAY